MVVHCPIAGNLCGEFGQVRFECMCESDNKCETKINSVKANEGGDLKVDADFKVCDPYGPGPLIPNPRIVAVFSQCIFAD